MNNRIIDIKSSGRKDFDLSFQLFFEDGHKATHYLDHPQYGLIFFWAADKVKCENEYIPNIKLSHPMNYKQASDMAWGWLEAQDKDKYKEYIDLDGSLIEAFRIFNEDWTHVAGSFYGILAVQPIWGWIGK